jgi:hypothetical protein
MALRPLSSLWLLVLALLMSAGCHSREEQRDARLHAAARSPQYWQFRLRFSAVLSCGN